MKERSSDGTTNSAAVATATMPERADGDVRGLARGAAALLDQPEHVGGIGPERLAGGRQPDAAADPLGQVDAELLGERGHRGGDRRLRDHELLGGRRHRAFAGDGEEAGELIER